MGGVIFQAKRLTTVKNVFHSAKQSHSLILQHQRYMAYHCTFHLGLAIIAIITISCETISELIYQKCVSLFLTNVPLRYVRVLFQL